MSRPRVVYWNSQPSPYFVERFNAAAATGRFRLEAWFDRERDADRSWDVDPDHWQFPGHYLPPTRIANMVMPFPNRRLWDRDIDVLVTPMDRLAGAVAAVAGRAFSRRVTSRTLPVFETWVKKTLKTESANRFLYRAIDGAKVSGFDAAAMAEGYGLPPERVWKVTQSIDLGLYGQALNVPKTDRDVMRRDLGLHGCVFIYVGRLDLSKGLEYLLEGFRKLEDEGCDASLLVLGDGPHEAEIRAMANDLHSVHFAGFVQAQMLPPWYAAADALVFPTLGDPNGLVVEEALAAGLPVICTANAGDIRARIQEGVTGFIVPPFDGIALADCMRRLAADPNLRASMGSAAVQVADNFSMDRYAEDFGEFITGVLALPPRRNACSVAAHILGNGLLRVAKPLT